MSPRAVRFLRGLFSVVTLLGLLSSCGGDATKPTGPIPTALIRVSGNGQSGTVGELLPNALVVKVVDATGAGVPDVTVHWAVRSGGGSLNTNSTTTDQTGQTLVALTLGSAPGADTVSASVAQLTPMLFTATAIGPPAKLAYAVQPTTATAGAPIVQAVKVLVQDVVGNTVTTATSSVTIAITSGTGVSGATLGGTLTQSASSGVATFGDLTIDKAATGYTLTATASGVTAAVSTAFNVTAGTAAKLAFTTEPSNVPSGQVITPAVQVTVQDVQGNMAASATNSITLAITSGTGTAGATLGGTVTRAAVNGVATFNDLNIVKTGNAYTLTATAANLTPATSIQFNVIAGPALHLRFLVQPSDVIAGQPITPAVQVAIVDASGNTVTTATDSIYTNFSISYGGTPGGTFRQKAVNGVATFNDLSINKAHTGFRLQTLSLDRDLGVWASDTFNVSVGPPAQLAWVTQPRDVMNDVVFDSLRVLVQDDQGNTVTTSSAAVTVAITNGTGAAGATLAGTVTRSADTGLVTFTDLSIDHVGTGYTLTVSSAGLTSDTTVPFRVVGPFTATQVSAAFYVFSCALVSAGGAYCWGYNGDGELGDGTNVGRDAPVAVSGGLTFATISGGGVHTCAVTTGAAAYCWGNGTYGSLGTGSTSSSSTPVPVAGGLAFASISTGVYHTCGVTTAGTAYCWGDGAFGVLGDSLHGDGLTPSRVVGGHVFASVSAGYNHSCGVTTAGDAYCWGDGTYGALGNGSIAAATFPVAVSGGLTFKSVSAGGEPNSCGLTTTGDAYCWGWNQYGQLGNGNTGTSSTTPVPVSGGLTFTAISAGDAHHCGLTAGGAMYCWGLNRFGQLGNGTTTDSNTPVAVSGGLTFTSVSAGRDHTCSLASTGIVYCWGYNASGELGDRTAVNRSVPVRVSAP